MDENVERLKELRKRKGWTQAEVARLLGVEKETISRWENARHRPHRLVREKLAALLSLYSM